MGFADGLPFDYIRSIDWGYLVIMIWRVSQLGPFYLIIALPNGPKERGKCSRCEYRSIYTVNC